MQIESKNFKECGCRAMSIIQDSNNNQFMIMEFNHKTYEVALYACNIDNEIAAMNEKKMRFVNLINPIQGHAGKIWRDALIKREWIRTPIEDINDFKVVYNH